MKNDQIPNTKSFEIYSKKCAGEIVIRNDFPQNNPGVVETIEKFMNVYYVFFVLNNEECVCYATFTIPNDWQIHVNHLHLVDGYLTTIPKKENHG